MGSNDWSSFHQSFAEMEKKLMTHNVEKLCDAEEQLAIINGEMAQYRDDLSALEKLKAKRSTKWAEGESRSGLSADLALPALFFPVSALGTCPRGVLLEDSSLLARKG